MPANLTQQYLKAEENYRRAQTLEEELACLQVMMKEIPKHKGTDHLQAELKSKIAKIKKEMVAEKSSGKKTRGLRIPRQGAGTVILLGGPNAGKSQLIASLTRATPEVAPYPFTTTAPAPAMMPWEDVTVQLIDTPPITADYMDSHLHGLIRAADLALLMVDLGEDNGIELCQGVLDRLLQTKTRLAAKSSLDEQDVGLSYTQTFLAPNKIDAPAPPSGWTCCTNSCRWIFPSTSSRPSTAPGWRRCGRRSTRRWTWSGSTRSSPRPRKPTASGRSRSAAAARCWRWPAWFTRIFWTG